MEVLSTVLTSALVASVVSPLVNAWLESRKERSGTQRDALTAAVALEGYAITCATKIQEHETAASSDGHAGSFLASVPALPELDVVAGFLRPRKVKLANRLSVFPQEVQQADQSAALWWELVGDMDAARNAAVRQTAHLGLRSLTLSADIREAFDLPSRNLTFGNHDVRGTLEKKDGGRAVARK